VISMATRSGSRRGRAERLSDNGAVFLFFLKDADHDGLDDVLRQLPNVHNPQQADADATGSATCRQLPCARQHQPERRRRRRRGRRVRAGRVQLPPRQAFLSLVELSLSCGAFNVTQVNGRSCCGRCDEPKTLT